jgi:succinate dehydrogenase hydrophobic anchor subunit
MSRGAQQVGNIVMVLLTAFIVTVVLGDLVAIGISAVVEHFSKPISLFVFLALFVAVIPVAWRIAVRFTEPKGTPRSQ